MPNENDGQKRIGSFIDRGDGTVTDTRTGLMWMRASLGQVWDGSTCIGVPKEYLWWEHAKKIAHHFAGFDDWRLPNLDELSSIVDLSQKNPSINADAFPKAPASCYWTSTPCAMNHSKESWVVDFRSGKLDSNSGSNNKVRLVRAGNALEPNSTFIDNGDGTITHALTGLTWMKCALGQTWNGSTCVGEPNQYTRDEATSIFHRFAEQSDWRLPSIGELNSIVDRSRYSPAADEHAFPGMPSDHYWTSSSGLTIEFWQGSTGSHSGNGNLVRLVRGATISDLILDAARNVSTSLPNKAFALNVLKTGTGSGDVIGGYEGETFAYGKSITLIAAATKGSVFNGWSGDATGVDSAVTFTVDSAKRVIAEFVKLDIPELEIALSFDSCDNASLKSGDDAFLVYLLVANQGPKQIRVELPLSSYVTRCGEEVTQDAWLSGLLNGAEGATIRAGTFRKTGLVFHKSKLKEILAGDHLHLTLAQTKPGRSFRFSFRCTDSKSLAFTLVRAIEEAVQVQEEENVSSAPDLAAMLRRIEMLEVALSEALSKLGALQAAPPFAGKIHVRESAPAPTLADVLAWLATQEMVSLAVLRDYLLPLDLLPSAVIDEINERALDLTGETAFEANGEEFVLVAREILAQAIGSETPTSNQEQMPN